MNTKLYKLEALRGLAAIYVVIHHTLPHQIQFLGFNVAYLIRFGQEAVILFFLLSGFVINYAFSHSRDRSFASYFSKRFTRIYIPLVLVFLIGYLATSYNHGYWIDPQFSKLLGNLFMLQDWGYVKPNVIVEPYLGNNPLWSLSYEWWFYMAYFPLISFWGKDESRDNFVFLVSVAGAVLYVIEPSPIFRLAMYFGIWWSGVYMCRIYLSNHWQSIKPIWKPLLTLGTIIVILCAEVAYQVSQGNGITFGKHPILEVRHFAFAFVAIVAAFVWRSRGWKLFDVLIKPFAFFAPVSYAIYIAHFHLFTDATYLGFIDNKVVEWVGYFAVTLLVSYVIERLIYPSIKKPLGQWLQLRVGKLVVRPAR